ncbi:MAG TPA: MSHA biogenesis protein MshK [Burkholderiales bacterium]|nr:MSHA biogenesis protein MshK [Burkholderiales bacterium]
MRLAQIYCYLLTGLATTQVLAAGPDAGLPAQGFADPTRPPYSGRANAADESPVAGPELQSVLISTTRNVAVINGQTVPLGGKFREATLIRITESGVELRSGSQVELLRLFPQVQKKSLPSDEPRRRN